MVPVQYVAGGGSSGDQDGNVFWRAGSSCMNQVVDLFH